MCKGLLYMSTVWKGLLTMSTNVWKGLLNMSSNVWKGLLTLGLSSLAVSDNALKRQPNITS